jgi:AcrR family transcriptional regulator
MSLDMSRGPTTERKDQILQAAIELIATEGYVSLSMRALARAVDMKLGALQYHFRTWEDLLHALVDFIREEYDSAFEELAESNKSHGVRETARFLLYDTQADDTLQADRLFPQLWAMAQVEPVMQSLLDEIYCRYLDILEEGFTDAGSRAPRAEALVFMSMAEGSTLFVGHGRRWARDAKAVRDAVYGHICANYPEKDPEKGEGKRKRR